MLYDFGAKHNIGRELVKRGCEVTVYPAFTKAEEILKTNPDGIMLSNGPGTEGMYFYYRRNKKNYITLKSLFLLFVWDISSWRLPQERIQRK